MVLHVHVHTYLQNKREKGSANMHYNLTKNSILCITVAHLKKLVYLQHLQTLLAFNIIYVTGMSHL